ncbi:MAG: hypothetical protein E4H23_01345 [Chrysiogenales bacterium]|nr:MAG: hypothetical protein E4H23_01345 [Chrysiogenales bacterium]
MSGRLRSAALKQIEKTAASKEAASKKIDFPVGKMCSLALFTVSRKGAWEMLRLDMPPAALGLTIAKT